MKLVDDVGSGRVFLHPLTEDRVVLERLAGVPVGSGVLFEVLEPSGWGEAEAGFLGFVGVGFGELRGEAREFLRLIGLDADGGSLTDPELVAGLLVCQGVELPEGVGVVELGGVEWV